MWGEANRQEVFKHPVLIQRSLYDRPLRCACLKIKDQVSVPGEMRGDAVTIKVISEEIALGEIGLLNRHGRNVIREIETYR